MTDFDTTLLWCVGQASLLAAMGGLAAILLTRWASRTAASTSAVAVVAVIAVTVLAPMELPTFQAIEPVDALSANAGSPAHRPALPNAASHAKDGGVSLAVGPLLKEWSRALRQAAEVAPAAAPRTFAVGVWVGALAVAAGVLRLAFAFAWVWKLRRRSWPVVDPRVLSLFDELCARLSVKRRPALRETAAIVSPAVVGWRRRIVLLPANRGGWDERQLRATLAHELAHVARGDFEWRLAASVMRAIHFFNPLAHWLARRLALAQELAADRMAAGATGGSAQYAAALASLALTLDRPQRIGADAILLPVFSHNLSRRLTMLRSTDGSTRGGWRSLVGLAAGCAIVLAAVATTALRSRVEATETNAAAKAAEPTGEAPSSARAFMASREGIGIGAKPAVMPLADARRPANEPVADGPESLGLFARPDDASMLLGDATQGAFVVRVGELARVPAFAQAVPLFNAMIHEQLKQQVNVPLQDIPEIHLEAIEWIAGVPRLKVKPKTGAEKGQEGQVTIECDGFVVRFRDKVDWKSWLVRALPATEEYESVRGEKLNYLELPPIPGETGFGNLQFMVAARDERTLVVATDVEQLRQLAQSTGAEANAGLGPEWKELDGGLATLIAKIDAKAPLGLTDEPGARLMESLLEKSSEFGLAFDTDPATRAAQIRLTLRAADPAATEQIKATLEELLPMLVAQIGAELDYPTQLHEGPDDPYRAVQTLGDADTDREVGEFWLAMIKSCDPQIVPRADGGVQVQLTAMATLPQQVMVAYEYEKKDAANEKDETERR